MRPHLLVALALAACSSDPSTGTPDAGSGGGGGAAAGGASAGGAGGSGGGSGGGGAGSAGAAGVAGTGGAAGAGGAAGSGGAGGAGGAGPLYRGRITLTLDENQQVTVAAAFDGVDGHPEACGGALCQCRYEASHPCMVSRCVETTTPPTQLTAGTLEFLDGDRSLGTATPDGTGYQGSFVSIILVPGATLRVQASGGDVPAFSTAVVVDSPLTLTSPTAGALLTRSAGLRFEWSGSPYTARFDVTEQDASPLSLDCVFGGGNGAGTIPPNWAAELAPGAATVQGAGVGMQELTVGDWRIHVALLNARLRVPASVTLE